MLREKKLIQLNLKWKKIIITQLLYNIKSLINLFLFTVWKKNKRKEKKIYRGKKIKLEISGFGWPSSFWHRKQKRPPPNNIFWLKNSKDNTFHALQCRPQCKLSTVWFTIQWVYVHNTCIVFFPRLLK
jgi:hypothetical protein